MDGGCLGYLFIGSTNRSIQCGGLGLVPCLSGRFMALFGHVLAFSLRGINSPSARRSSIGFRVGFQQLPDTVSPELELFGVTDVPHELGEPWAEPGYAASDDRDGNLTNSVTISGTFDVNTSGTYTLTYTVADAAGNEANATRTVTVIDSGTDTDGDGFDDYIEAVAGSGSNDSSSTPFNYGLVAWYPFDGNASDMSGNGNHGTVNGATLGTDRHGVAGKAYKFDGVDDWIQTSASEKFTIQSELSVSLWFELHSFEEATLFRKEIQALDGNGSYGRVMVLQRLQFI